MHNTLLGHSFTVVETPAEATYREGCVPTLDELAKLNPTDIRMTADQLRRASASLNFAYQTPNPKGWDVT